MKVIDEILNEWSFRCHDGIVDLNNPEKVKILFEILKEDIDDDVLNALINTGDDIKLKVLKQLKKVNKEESNELEDKLKNKNLNDSITEHISLLAMKYGLSDDLLDYLNSPNKLSLSDLENGNNLLDIIHEKTNFNKNFIFKIIIYSSEEKGKGVGIGEIALAVFFDAEKVKKGDVKIDGKLIELKGNEARFSGSGKGRSGDISYLYEHLSKEYGIESKINLASYISEIIKEHPEALDDINDKLNDIYPNTEDIKITSENINATLNKKYIASYVNNHKNDYYMLISNNSSSYILYTSETIIEAVGNKEISFKGNISKSNSYPQIYTLQNTTT